MLRKTNKFLKNELEFKNVKIGWLQKFETQGEILNEPETKKRLFLKYTAEYLQFKARKSIMKKKFSQQCSKNTSEKLLKTEKRNSAGKFRIFPELPSQFVIF